MSKEPADLNLKNEAKKKVIRYGGTYEMDRDQHEYFHEWLLFLSNPLNLQPGLPDIKILIDSRQLDSSSFSVSFNKRKASMRSLKFELVDFHSESTELFLDDPKKNTSLIDGKPNDPCRLKKWVFNLFVHSELKELELPSIEELRELLNKLPNTKIVWTPFTPSTNVRY